MKREPAVRAAVTAIERNQADLKSRSALNMVGIASIGRSSGRNALNEVRGYQSPLGPVPSGTAGRRQVCSMSTRQILAMTDRGSRVGSCLGR